MNEITIKTTGDLSSGDWLETLSCDTDELITGIAIFLQKRNSDYWTIGIAGIYTQSIEKILKGDIDYKLKYAVYPNYLKESKILEKEEAIPYIYKCKPFFAICGIDASNKDKGSPFKKFFSVIDTNVKECILNRNCSIGNKKIIFQSEENHPDYKTLFGGTNPKLCLTSITFANGGGSINSINLVDISKYTVPSSTNCKDNEYLDENKCVPKKSCSNCGTEMQCNFKTGTCENNNSVKNCPPCKKGEYCNQNTNFECKPNVVLTCPSCGFTEKCENGQCIQDNVKIFGIAFGSICVFFIVCLIIWLLLRKKNEQ